MHDGMHGTLALHVEMVVKISGVQTAGEGLDMFK